MEKRGANEEGMRPSRQWRKGYALDKSLGFTMNSLFTLSPGMTDNKPTPAGCFLLGHLDLMRRSQMGERRIPLTGLNAQLTRQIAQRNCAVLSNERQDRVDVLLELVVRHHLRGAVPQRARALKDKRCPPGYVGMPDRRLRPLA